MAVADGKKFKFLDETNINSSFLEVFDFNSPEQYIKTETNEFSAVCPFSGLPDIANVIIEYYPIGGKCVELKALKYYFTSFRNVGICLNFENIISYNLYSAIYRTTSVGSV